MTSRRSQLPVPAEEPLGEPSTGAMRPTSSPSRPEGLARRTPRLRQPRPSRADPRDIVRAHVLALSQGRLRRALSFLSADAVVELPMLPAEECDHGRFGAWLRAVLTAFPDLRIHLIDLEQRNGTVLTRWVVTGTFKGPFLGRPPTAKRIVVRGIALDRVEGRRIVQRKLLWDSAQLLTQLEVVPVVA